jgi:hypothetical protein
VAEQTAVAVGNNDRCLLSNEDVCFMPANALVPRIWRDALVMASSRCYPPLSVPYEVDELPYMAKTAGPGMRHACFQKWFIYRCSQAPCLIRPL